MAEFQLTEEQAAVIGLKIRESRLQLGLQQKDLVQGQFSKSYISLIESGRVAPSSKALKVIADRLGVSVEALVKMATPGPGTTGASEGEAEVFGRWELVLDEARISLFQKDPAAAINVLLNKIKTRQLSSNQLKHYHFLLGSAYLDSAEYDPALAEFKTALQMAQSLGDVEMQARITHKLGTVYTYQNKYMLSLENFQKALELINSQPVPDLKFKLQVLSSLGDCYQKVGDHQHAVQYYNEARELAVEWQDLPGVAALNWQTGQQFRENQQTARARAYAAKAIALYEALDSMDTLIESKLRLGMLLIDRPERESAEKYLQEALELARQTGNARLAAVAGLNLAQLYSQTGQAGKALELAGMSVEHARLSGDPATIGQALARQALAHHLNHEPEKSRELFVEALEQLQDNAGPDILAQTYFE